MHIDSYYGDKGDSTVIRPCSKGDIPILGEIYAIVYQEFPYHEKWKVAEASCYLEKFRSMEPEHCIVAYDTNGVQGGLFSYTYPWQGLTVLYIQEIFVDTSLQGHGIGTELVSHITRQLSRVTPITLLVNSKSNAVGFYKKLGLCCNSRMMLYSGLVRVKKG